MKISTACRNAACDAIVDLIDGGSGAGTMQIRTGAPPGTFGAVSGTLLATLTFSDPAFGAASTGTATANSITSDTSVDSDGTAGHFRVLDSSGTVIWQGTVGTSGADINFNTVTFVAGGTCSISSLTFMVPEGT